MIPIGSRSFRGPTKESEPGRRGGLWLGGFLQTRRWAGLALAWLGASLVLRATIFYTTADPDHNTTAPDGLLAESGWQWQGLWNGFSGTPIAPNLFITARHVGGSVGDDFVLNGAAYRTVTRYVDEKSDLTIWRVCPSFPSFAPLYEREDEVGAECVIFGRGLGRGGAVQVEGELKGWRWDGNGRALRWGRNRISGVATLEVNGPMLAFAFDADGVPDEAGWASGDSSGALFLNDGGTWRLAGVASAVDGPFRLTAEGEDFNATLFDQTGLFRREQDGWARVPARGFPQPTRSYATRISARLAWIRSVIDAQEPALSTPVLEVADQAQGGWREASDWTLDPGHHLILTPRFSSPTFYRLRYCRPLRLVSIEPVGEWLELHYE